MRKIQSAVGYLAWTNSTRSDRWRRSGKDNSGGNSGILFERLESRVLLSSAPVSTTWTDVATPVPANDGAQIGILLSNGMVMFHGSSGPSGSSADWYGLTPNSAGSYVNGTWSTLASMSVAKLYFGSNVLPNGDVFVVGGEYASDKSFSPSAELYDPFTNVWTNEASFPTGNFGDDPTEVLPNGTVLAGGGAEGGRQTYIFNPATDKWTAGPNKFYNDSSDEECWVKLPDGSILTYDIDASKSAGVGKAERYIPSENKWVDASAGTLPILSTSGEGDELGGAILLPDGRALYTGANGKTAFFNSKTDTWSAGPTMPVVNGVQMTMGDAPIAQESNGDVLMALSPAVYYNTSNQETFPGPTYIYDFNPNTGVYTNVTPASNIIYTGSSYNSYNFTMLDLPNGQIALTNFGSQVAIYTPDGAPNNAWRPVINNVVKNTDGSYTLTGTQLNGLGEGAAYGDDNEMSSNYPLVQITDSVNHNVLYATSYNWSLTGVATAATSETVNFTLPAALGAHAFSLKVIANGIASNSYTPGAPHLVFHVQPTNAVAGVAINPPVVVYIENSNNQIITSDNSNVNLTVWTGLGAVNVTVAAKAGIATFNEDVIITTAGAYMLLAKDGSDNAGISGSFNITAAAAAKLAFFATPATAAAGKNISPGIVVDVEDKYGNIVTTNASKVTLAVHLGPGAIFGTTAVNAVAGAATFSAVNFQKTGSYTLSATEAGLTSATSGSFAITAGAVAHLAFVQNPTNAVAGANIAPAITVTATDAYGNLVIGASVKLAIGTGPAGGALFGTVTATTNASGVATFTTVSAHLAGSYTLVASVGAVSSAKSTQFVISHAALAKLAFVQNPTNVVAGANITPAITVKATDAYGNIIAGASVKLAIGSGPAGGGLFGTITAITAATGIATFSTVSLHLAGAYTLTASVGAVVSAKSSIFTVAAAAANKLVFTTLPSTVKHAVAFTVKISVEDVYGNVRLAQNSGTITLALATHTTGSSLGGTLMETVVKGVATFSNLTLSLAGTFSLKATDSFSITTVTSVTFTAN